MVKGKSLNPQSLSGFGSAIKKAGYSHEFAKAFDLALAQDDVFDFDDFDENFLNPLDGFGEDPELDELLITTTRENTKVPLFPTTPEQRARANTNLESTEAQNLDTRFDEQENINQQELEDFARENDLNTRLVTYMTQQDSKVDDLICLPLQGEVYEIDDPNRPIIPDSTHPNCRCFYEDTETGDFLGQDGQFASGSIATAVKEDGKEGQWRTVNGTPVFFPDGEDEKGVIDKAFKDKATPKETKQPAPTKTVDFGKVREQYQRKLSDLKEKEGFSFNPNSGKTTDAFTEKEAVRFFDDHSVDGKDVYVISKTNNLGGLNRRSESAYSQIINEGRTPLIGNWKDPKTGFEYNDVSFPVSGISDNEAKGLLKRNAQESALVISKGGKVRFLDG